MSKSPSVKLKWVCQEIADDMERDVDEFNRRVLDGSLVAEIHANLAAAIAGLAKVVEQLCPEEEWLQREEK